MKFNKIAMFALLSAAIVSHINAHMDRPEKVEQCGKNKLDVKDKHKNKWTRFERTENPCQVSSHHKKGKTEYEYANKRHTALNVTKDGSCKVYVKEQTLSPNERETIMIEDVFED